MVKLGYASSLAEAQEMPARSVVQALYYEEFLADYERAYLELNKE